MSVTVQQDKYIVNVGSDCSKVEVHSSDYTVNLQMCGIQGPPGLSAEISADPENILSFGTDSKLYAPPPQLASNQW